MSESEPKAPAPPSFSMPRLMITIVIVLLIALVAFNIGKQVEQPDPTRTKRILGMTDPTPRVMAEGLADADGDLVADPPADAAAHVDPEAILFSFVASPEAEQSEQAWQPLADHLSSVTGKPVQYVRFDDEREQLEALSDGRLHVTALNTGNVPEAVAACGFVPVVSPAQGEARHGYTMQIIVPADSPIQKPADLKGKQIAFTTAGSNSGYKAPIEVLMRQFRLNPEADYKMVFSMGHNQSIAGIASGKYQAAAVANDLLDQAVAAGEVKASDYRVIYESEQFPSLAIGHAHNLAPALAGSVSEALLSFKPAGTAAAGQLAEGVTGFASVSYKDDWSLVRRIDESFNKAQ